MCVIFSAPVFQLQYVCAKVSSAVQIQFLRDDHLFMVSFGLWRLEMNYLQVIKGCSVD